MNIIRHNPFRVLGLLSNTSERELQKQIGIIKRYAEVGKVKAFDYDFEIIGKLNRTQDEIQQASNKIEQSQKKLHYSLFWFIENNQLDEIAHSNLRDNNIDKAIEIWDKTLKDGVTDRNFTAYLNLSTLYIALATISDEIIQYRLKQGILLKAQLINSQHLNDLSKLVTRSEVIVDSIDVGKKFADEIVELLKKYLNKRSGISTHELISLFDSFPQSIQKYVSNKFSEAPLLEIETKIEQTIKQRKNNSTNAHKYGENLYTTTKDNLLLLSKIIGKDSPQFKMLANKLANEILQCSIDYFNELRDSDDFDPGDAALKIAKYAKLIVFPGREKDRLEESLMFIQEWVDDKPKRKREKAVSDYVDYITDQIKDFQQKTDSLENVRLLIVTCEEKLTNVKNILGPSDDLYLTLSSAIVGNALGAVIAVVNNEQDQVEYDKTKLKTLPYTFATAVSILSAMKNFDMKSETRNRFNTNTKVIGDIHSQLQAFKSQPPAPSSGCYIATMAYGSYDHPQVMILRKFRDEKLSNYIFGKSFIKIYYIISPYLVRALKDNHSVNGTIRSILDKFVNKVK